MHFTPRNAVAVTVALALAGAQPKAPAGAAEGKVVARSTRVVAGRTYTFEKVLDEAGNVQPTIRRDGRLVLREPVAVTPLVSDALLQRLAQAAETDIIAVLIGL